MLTPEGSLNLRNIADLQFSPVEEGLAFVVTEPARGTGRLKHIWVYEWREGWRGRLRFRPSQNRRRDGRLRASSWLFFRIGRRTSSKFIDVDEWWGGAGNY